MDEPKPTISDLVAKNSELIKNSEKIVISLLLLGLTLHFLEIKNTGFILIIGCIATALIYFFSAFSVIDFENLETIGILNSFAFINFIYKLTFLGLSIASLSVLSLTITSFKFTELITVSGLTLAIVLIFSSITRVNDRTNIYNTIYYLRVILALLILIYLANLKFHWF
jgi:hypothetical protein